MAAIKFPPGTMWWRGGIGLPGFSSAPAEFSPLDLSPALWIDPSDASTVTISGSSGAYIGPNGLVLNGQSNDRAISAHLASYTVTTGAVEMEIDFTSTSLAAGQGLIQKGTAKPSLADYNYGVYIGTGGNLFFRCRIAGAIAGAGSTATVTAGVRERWKVTADPNVAGQLEVKFFKHNGSTFVLQDTVVQTLAATAFDANSLEMAVGGFGGGGSAASSFVGTIHRATVRSGIGGTTVFDADFESATPYVSAFTEAALGAPVYVVSSTATDTPFFYAYVGPEGLVCPGAGTANRAETPDAAALDITGDLDIIVRVRVPFAAPAAQSVIVDKYQTAGQRSYSFSIGNNGQLLLEWSTNGTDTPFFYDAVGAGLVAGGTYWLRASLDVDNGAGGHTVTFRKADDSDTVPSSWTTLNTRTGAGTTSVFASSSALNLGIRGTSIPLLGVIKRAIVKSGIDGTTVFDADFTAAPDYATSFTESSTNAATVTITATNTPAKAAGALVSQINDKSGNARHLTRGTAASMPKYWNGRNGKNVLVFDGSNDSMASALDASTLPASFLTVVSLTALGAARTIVGSSAAADGLQFRSASTNRPELLKQGVSSLGAGTNTLTQNLAVVVDVTTTAGAQAHYLNGVANGTSANAVSLTTCTTIVGSDQAATQMWQGLICELVKMDAVASAQNLSDWYAYANPKWGTP